MKRGKTYQWRKGVRHGGVKAEVAAAELQRLHEEEGEVTPAAVVEAARPKDAPLHPAFEWRDAVAAEEYRLMQARTLVRAVIVVDEQQNEAPMMVHVSTQEPAYQPVELVVERPDLYVLALSDLEARARSAQRAVEELERAAKASSKNEDLLARIGLVARAFETALQAVKTLH